MILDRNRSDCISTHASRYVSKATPPSSASRVCEDRRVDEVETEPGPELQPAKPSGETFMGIAGAAIVFAMLCVLIGAMVGALSLEGTGPDVWKVKVRLMSVSASGQYGALLIALSLLVALGLTVGAAGGVSRPKLRSAVVIAAVGASVWLGLLVVLNIYVDITEIDPADIAIATVLGDLGAFVMLATAGMWGFALASARRS